LEGLLFNRSVSLSDPDGVDNSFEKMIRTPPHWDAEKNGYEFCYHCPDATIRNGKLTPVCIADLVNPLPGFASASIDRRLYEDAYTHLQEI